MLLYFSKFDILIFKKVFTECFKHLYIQAESRYTFGWVPKNFQNSIWTLGISSFNGKKGSS